MNRFRGGLVSKAHRLLYHSTLGLRVIKKKKKHVSSMLLTREGRSCAPPGVALVCGVRVLGSIHWCFGFRGEILIVVWGFGVMVHDRRDFTLCPMLFF